MSDVLAVRNGYRLEQWSQIIAECQSSGQSNRKYCMSRGISEKTYYYWLRKLRTVAIDHVAPELIKLEAPNPAATGRTLETAIKIRYHDAELELPVGTEAATLAAVLMAIRDIC